MKRSLLIILIAAIFCACEKDDESDIKIGHNTIAEDLKQIIEAENVELVLPCRIGGNCSGGSPEFSFPGDNFILVSGDRYFNLNYLIRTEIRTDAIDRVRMTLYFDPF